MAVITITTQELNQVKRVLAFPGVENLLLSDDQIMDYAVFPSMRKYFVKFPIVIEQSQSIIGETIIAFPDDNTFGVVDVRTVDVGLIGGVGGSFWDVVSYQSYNNSYISSKTTGAYGKKGYNPSGLIYQRDVQRQTMKSQQNQYATIKSRVDYPNKRLIAYSSITGTLNISWAKFSDDFDDVKYEYKEDVIKLSQAELMLHLANSAAILVDTGLEVTINTDYLKSSAAEIFTDVAERWAQIPDMILLHQV